MCESDVWARYPDGQSEKIADDVLYVTQEGEEVVLRWFLKEPLRVVGRGSSRLTRSSMWSRWRRPRDRTSRRIMPKPILMNMRTGMNINISITTIEQ